MNTTTDKPRRTEFGEMSTREIMGFMARTDVTIEELWGRCESCSPSVS
jgi:hypothetical protein